MQAKEELTAGDRPVLRRRVTPPMLESFFQEVSAKHSIEQVTFVCIGTDRSTGDALGPLTGSRLAGLGFPSVVGTLPDPCDADTLGEKLLSIPEHQVIIAVDACLGSDASVGTYLVGAGPLQPAESVGGKLPLVGDFSLAAVVNRKGPRPYQALQMTSLYKVMNMADEIAAAAALAFGLK